MEIILLIIVWIFGGFIWRAVTSAGSSAVKAAQGKGTFTENMEAQWQGIYA